MTEMKQRGMSEIEVSAKTVMSESVLNLNSEKPSGCDSERIQDVFHEDNACELSSMTSTRRKIHITGKKRKERGIHSVYW